MENEKFGKIGYLMYNIYVKSKKGAQMKKLLVIAAVAGFAFAYTDCAMCHNGSMATKLDKLTPAQIVQKMKEFKAGKGNQTMVGIAQGMSEKEIEEAAKKYGKK
jgi:cytochrome c553